MSYKNIILIFHCNCIVALCEFIRETQLELILLILFASHQQGSVGTGIIRMSLKEHLQTVNTKYLKYE